MVTEICRRNRDVHHAELGDGNLSRDGIDEHSLALAYDSVTTWDEFWLSLKPFWGFHKNFRDTPEKRDARKLAWLMSDDED